LIIINPNIFKRGGEKWGIQQDTPKKIPAKEIKVHLLEKY